jgi:hypothetical protein
MLLLLVSLYLLLGVLASQASTTFLSYILCLTAWPLVIFGLALCGRFGVTPRFAG